MAKSKFFPALVEGSTTSDEAINAFQARPAGPPNKPANDSGLAVDLVQVDAALTRIAEAIGRHIARQHIRAHKAANDAGPREDPLSADP